MDRGTKRKNDEKPTLTEIAARFIHRDNDLAYCRIEGENIEKKCKYAQSRYEPGNFIRHFRSQHPALARQYGLWSNQPTTPSTPPAKKLRPIPKVPVPVDKQLLVNSSIKLVSFHHLPVKCFEWEGLRDLYDPLGAALGIKINPPNVKGHIYQAVSKMTARMSLEMKNRMLSLMVDSATRLNHHVLGVGVQFVVDGKVVVRTLGMLEIRERQTADFLKGKILEILDRFDVKLEQIFSITVDNGANMLACIRKLKDELESSIVAQLLDESEDVTIAIAAEVADKLHDDFLDQARVNLMLMRCSVHTLQLAVLSVVDKRHAMVQQITEIAKRCRAMKYKTDFDYRKAKYPPVWCQTRWGGIYKMVESFLEQREFFTDLSQQFPELDLSSSWQFMEQYAEAFKPCYICTKKLQETHVSLGDFYMEWLMTIFSVKKLKNNQFAHDLEEALTNRLTKLRESMAVKMALYVDPRFNFINSKIFKDENTEKIQSFIILTWNRMKQLDPHHADEQTCSTSTSMASSERDDFITEMFGGTLDGSNASSATFQQQLKALEGEKRQNTNYDVWDHWRKRESSHPELSAVALQVLTVPSTQSMVERAFNALGLILTPHRSTLSDETLEKILLVKLNKEVYAEISGNLYKWNEELVEN